MKVVIDIPDEFRGWFEGDHFSDSFGRIISEVKMSPRWVAGPYEEELLDMLSDAFGEAEIEKEN